MERRPHTKTVMDLARTTNEVEAGVQTRADTIDSQKLCRLFVPKRSSDENNFNIHLIDRKERDMIQPLRSDDEKL